MRRREAYVAHVDTVSRVADVDDDGLNRLRTGRNGDGQFVLGRVEQVRHDAREGRTDLGHVGRVKDLDLVAGSVGSRGDAVVGVGTGDPDRTVRKKGSGRVI
jgi:hypothetical protein